MGIWFQPYSLEELQQRGRGTMIEQLDIRITAIGDDYLEGTMPVDQRTIQPHGILHGGANVALAETLGSLAANLVVDPQQRYCVGLEVNANHLRPVRTGQVTGHARPLHLGGTTQVWSIEIREGDGKLSCISRLTMAVLTRR